MCEPDANIFSIAKTSAEIPNVKSTHNSLVEKSYYDNEIKGRAILFNHYKFIGNTNTPRTGTAYDVLRLKKALEKLNFNVDLYQDYKYVEIITKMKEVARMKRSDLSCLIVIVMTHGDTYGRVSAYDITYYVNILWEMLASNKCKQLIGIPKIFLIQACRGSQEDKGTIVTDSVEKIEPQYLKYPKMADFLQMYSSYSGFVSYRYPDGSWFLQSLCQVLETRGEEWHLLDMLTVVNNKVALNFTTEFGDKQMPQIVSMLTKFWKFKRNQNSGFLNAL